MYGNHGNTRTLGRENVHGDDFEPLAPRIHSVALYPFPGERATVRNIRVDIRPGSINQDPPSAGFHQHILPGLNQPVRPAPVVPRQTLRLTHTSAVTSAAAIAEAARPLIHPPTNVLACDGEAMVKYTALPTPPPPCNTPQEETFWHRCSSLASRYEKKIRVKREGLALLLMIFCCFLILEAFRPERSVDHSSAINKYIDRLNYSSNKTLVYRGETVVSVPREARLDQCFVIQRRKQSVWNGKTEVGIVASSEHRTFPGSLLLANSRLVDNCPDMLVVDRALLTYTVNLPGLTDDGSFTITPSFSEYQAAVNKVLNTWFDRYSTDRSVAANFYSIESLAYSKQLLRVKFGLDFFNSLIESSIDFNAVAEGKKLIRLYKFTQVFYTVSVKPPTKPADLFGSGVTVCELEEKNNDNNPPVLVDSVSYGRIIYVKLETTSTEKQAELDINYLDIEAGLRAANDLKDLVVQIYVVGGNTNHTELISVTDLSQVRDIIKKFSQFSKRNIGYPISYSSQFIADNQKAVVHLYTDYVETASIDVCRKGVIKLIQSPWVCRWKVTWTEYSYDVNGIRVEQKKEWGQNLKVIKMPFESEDIEIPSYVEDLRVVAEAWRVVDKWMTVMDHSNIPIIPRRTFYIHVDKSAGIVPPLAK